MHFKAGFVSRLGWQDLALKKFLVCSFLKIKIREITIEGRRVGGIDLGTFLKRKLKAIFKINSGKGQRKYHIRNNKIQRASKMI